MRSEDYPRLLKALQIRLAEAVDAGCSPRDLVSLSRRLVDVTTELDLIPARRLRSTMPKTTSVERNT